MALIRKRFLLNYIKTGKLNQFIARNQHLSQKSGLLKQRAAKKSYD